MAAASVKGPPPIDDALLCVRSLLLCYSVAHQRNAFTPHSLRPIMTS